jgi:hypothetical protein
LLPSSSSFLSFTTLQSLFFCHLTKHIDKQKIESDERKESALAWK